MPSELEKFAAYVKTAIQYQSPKMQQILQGALDQAWQAGRGVRPPPGVYRARLARESIRDPVKGVARYNALRDRADSKLIARMFEEGGARYRTTLPPMSKPEMTRQLIFGAGDVGGSRQRADSLPRSWRYATRELPWNRASLTGLRGEIDTLRRGWANASWMERAVSRKLSDPRIQRVIEHQAPGGVEQLRKHMLAARGEGPVPAFDIKKLRGG